jgi:RHS repeat-associated protein
MTPVGCCLADVQFNERTFTGHINDAETGLIYMGARYYDAALGRFISADTIIASLANPQSLNRYSYVYNNPINGTDPTGHYSCDVENEYGQCQGGETGYSGNPNAGNTNTNTPGGSNTPPANAQNAGDTGGNDAGGGFTPDEIANNPGQLPSLPSGEYGFEWICTSGGQLSTCSDESHTFAIRYGQYLIRIWITESHLADWQKPNAILLYFEHTKMVSYLAIDPEILQVPFSRYEKVAQFHEKLDTLSKMPTGIDVLKAGLDIGGGCISSPGTCGPKAAAVSISKFGGAVFDNIAIMEQTKQLNTLFYSIPPIYMTSYIYQTEVANPAAGMTPGLGLNFR